MNKAILGIDPGKDGGFCLLLPNGDIHYMKSPMIGGAMDEVGVVDAVSDLVTIAHEQHLPITAFIEDVHSLHGSSAKSNFEFGGNVKFIRGVILAYRVPLILVQPKKWQSKCWIGIKIQRKKDKNGKMSNDTKKTSLLAAKRLFPSETFIAPNGRKPHDGIVDAALVAYYGMNFHFNQG